MSKKISNERKTLYYIGMILVILGVILFFSGFIMDDGFGMTMGPGFGMGIPAFFQRAVIGMICIIVGSVLMNIGARGAAGSGLLLDPEKAREDLKPYSTAAGGMINDVIENIDLVKDKNKDEDKDVIIKVKCRKCGELNDEDAKFCKSCGDRM